jgi:hypothetical protein
MQVGPFKSSTSLNSNCYLQGGIWDHRTLINHLAQNPMHEVQLHNAHNPIHMFKVHNSMHATHRIQVHFAKTPPDKLINPIDKVIMHKIHSIGS